MTEAQDQSLISVVMIVAYGMAGLEMRHITIMLELALNFMSKMMETHSLRIMEMQNIEIGP